MTDTDRKEVDNLAKLMRVFSGWDWGESDCIRIAEQMIKEGYSKRPQDNNAEEGETKNDIAWQQGYAAGKKDNSGMVSLELIKELELLKSYFEDRMEVVLHRNDIKWKAIDDFLISAQQPPKDQYPCNDCGKLRSKAEGGTTFSICDECWDKKYPKERKVSLEDIQNVIYFENRKQSKYLSMIDIHNIAEAILSLLNATEERKGE